MDVIKIYEDYILKTPAERDEYLNSILSHLTDEQDLFLNHILNTRPYNMTKDEEKRYYRLLRENSCTEFRLKKILIDLQTLTDDPRIYRDMNILGDTEKSVRSSSLNLKRLCDQT